MRFAALMLLLLASAGAQADDFWSGLWQTADQRGEQLLRQGDAAAAAKTYADPRRRAYAELRAGDYAAAARDFAAFDDADAHYNRGNALARAGDPEAALKAYDAALARDPDNHDARHNRDLVAQALKQQPPPQQQRGGQGQSGKQPGKPSASQDKSAQQGAGQSGNESQGNGAQGKSAPGQDKQAGKQTGDKPGTQDAASKPGDRQPGTGTSQAAGADSASEARRDAQAALARETGANTANAKPGTGAAGALDAGTEKANLRSGEQRLAREQWLRQIPDDPGGLLRRKFMIEHLIRQQGNPP